MNATFETILVANNYVVPNHDLVYVQEVIADDLYLVKTKETVEHGFRGVVVSLKNDKIVCPGSRWFAKCSFENYSEVIDGLKNNTEHKYQLAHDGTIINIFYYEGKIFISTNGKCLSVQDIMTNSDNGSKWNYAYTKKNTDVFNIHKFVAKTLFSSYIQGDDEHLARYFKLMDGKVLTKMFYAKQLLMCNKNTSIYERFYLQDNRNYILDRQVPFVDLPSNEVQTFDNIQDAIHFHRATTSQEFTNVIGEPEDEILAINKTTGQVEFCISTKKVEERRFVCQGNDEEHEIVNDIYHINSGRAFNVSYRVNQLFNIASVKDLGKVSTLTYLTNDIGMGTTISRILLAKVLNTLTKLKENKSIKGSDRMHHWFLHMVPLGYWMHGMEFSNPEFQPEDDEPYHNLLDYHGIDPSMVYAFSVKNERMEILSKVLLNLFKAINTTLWDDLVDAVVQCFYERMYVANLVFSGVVFVEKHLNQIADSELRTKLKDRVMYLMNGMDNLSVRAKKYRISNRVMELPSWRVSELFENL